MGQTSLLCFKDRNIDPEKSSIESKKLKRIASRSTFLRSVILKTNKRDNYDFKKSKLRKIWVAKILKNPKSLENESKKSKYKVVQHFKDWLSKRRGTNGSKVHFVDHLQPRWMVYRNLKLIQGKNIPLVISKDYWEKERGRVVDCQCEVLLDETFQESRPKNRLRSDSLHLRLTQSTAKGSLENGVSENIFRNLMGRLFKKNYKDYKGSISSSNIGEKRRKKILLCECERIFLDSLHSEQRSTLVLDNQKDEKISIFSTGFSEKVYSESDKLEILEKNEFHPNALNESFLKNLDKNLLTNKDETNDEIILKKKNNFYFKRKQSFNLRDSEEINLKDDEKLNFKNKKELSLKNEEDFSLKNKEENIFNNENELKLEKEEEINFKNTDKYNMKTRDKFITSSLSKTLVNGDESINLIDEPLGQNVISGQLKNVDVIQNDIESTSINEIMRKIKLEENIQNIKHKQKIKSINKKKSTSFATDNETETKIFLEKNKAAIVGNEIKLGYNFLDYFRNIFQDILKDNKLSQTAITSDKSKESKQKEIIPLKPATNNLTNQLGTTLKYHTTNQQIDFTQPESVKFHHPNNLTFDLPSDDTPSQPSTMNSEVQKKKTYSSSILTKTKNRESSGKYHHQKHFQIVEQMHDSDDDKSSYEDIMMASKPSEHMQMSDLSLDLPRLIIESEEDMPSSKQEDYCLSASDKQQQHIKLQLQLLQSMDERISFVASEEGGGAVESLDKLPSINIVPGAEKFKMVRSVTDYLECECTVLGYATVPGKPDELFEIMDCNCYLCD